MLGVRGPSAAWDVAVLDPMVAEVTAGTMTALLGSLLAVGEVTTAKYLDWTSARCSHHAVA